MKSLIVVCDDAGFASVDRGIALLVERTGVHVFAEYLIDGDGAIERAKAMSAHPLVSVGIHLELTGIADADRVAMTRDLKEKGTTLGEQPDIRRKACDDARRQLATFRGALGKDPAHVSTHGDFHLDASGTVMPWWDELMAELFGGNPPPMQWEAPVIRHNAYSWNIGDTKREPLTPEEFGAELARHTSDVVEFVLHPAWPQPDDAPLGMLFDARMRVRDVEAGIRILASGCIPAAGFGLDTGPSRR